MTHRFIAACRQQPVDRAPAAVAALEEQLRQVTVG